MQWWNDFVAWFTSTDARTAVFSAVVLALAVIVGGLLAAWIARGSLKGLISRNEREQKAVAIAALVDAATEASVWNSLTPQEQVLSDRAVGQADIHLRLLPIRGAGAAATWASHQLAEFKRSSATFGYQLDPALGEFRDRLVEWQNKPSRARKIFQDDLERWSYDGADADRSLTAKQDAWVAQQHQEQYAPSSATDSSPATNSGPTTNTGPAADSGRVSGPDTQTQRLMDDVEALDARREAANSDTQALAAPISAYPARSSAALES